MDSRTHGVGERLDPPPHRGRSRRRVARSSPRASMTLYSVVIATYERPSELHTTLECLAAQTHPPAQVVVVDASPSSRSAAIAREFESRLPLRYERATTASAAKQRNQGGALVTTPLIAFIDDDVFIPPPSLGKISAAFAQDAAVRSAASRRGSTGCSTAAARAAAGGITGCRRATRTRPTARSSSARRSIACPATPRATATSSRATG